MNTDYLFLVPLSLVMALIALVAFMWSLHAEQFDDLDGAAERILIDDDTPIVPAADAQEET